MDVILTEEMHGMVVVGVVALLSLAFAWRVGFFHFPKESLQPDVSLIMMLGAFVVFLGSQIVLGPLLLRFGAGLTGNQLVHLDEQTRVWAGIFFITLAFVGVLAYCFWLWPVTKSFFSTTQLVRDISIGIAVWFISYPLVTTIGFLLENLISLFTQQPSLDQLAVRELKTASQYPELLWLMLLDIIILAPLIEEILFRGFLQSYLNTIRGRWLGIVLTSFIFALFHFSPSQGVSNVEVLGSLFFFSCFLGFVRERQQTLWTPIALHMTFNGISVLIIFAQMGQN